MKNSAEYTNHFRILKGGKISLVVSALLGSVTITFASPSGGVVTSGSATISNIGKTTDITQSTQRASINWQKFNIAHDEVVNFKQPNASAITLNRVVGNERSVIDGALNANGQVWLLNSNGVLFGKNASINTAGLLATTSKLSDADFNAGNYNFTDASSNSIINLGTITISDKGYALLVGKEVENQGNIIAVQGKVHLVGAEQVSINLNGNSLLNLRVDKGTLDAIVKNSGSIKADGGEVYLTTNAVDELLKGVVNNTGIIEAESLGEMKGKIELFAHGGVTHVDGTLDATGGFIETSGKSLHVEDSTIIKTAKWLLDPDNVTIDGSAGAIGGETVGATAIQNALVSADVEIQATQDITVNENITWANATKLTLTAGDEVYVNATIKNTNTTDGGVYFNAANVRNKVIFGTNGKVIIYNPYQLQWMNQALAGKYELGSDIDASVTSSWNSGKGWMPIVTSEQVSNEGMTTTNYYGFSGTFDGLGHTISNLTINDATKDYVGFFGQTDGATIQNIGLVDVAITGKNNVGALAGVNSAISTIKNAYATGTVSGQMWVGGLAGNNTNGSTIQNSYAIVNVSGTSQVGGLVGYHSTNAHIITSYASGTVHGTSHVGGLYGYENTPPITNSYYDKDANTGAMHDNALGKTKANLLALVTGGTWSNIIWGTDGSQAEGYADNKGLPFLKGVTKFNTLFQSGFGDSTNPYTITNWTQLQNINYNSNVLTGNYFFSLSNNLISTTAGYTNTGTGWTPIGNSSTNFKGTFDGANHTISNLVINRAGEFDIGLFGYTNDATIKNIGLVNVNITGELFVGGLVGDNYNSSITNSYATGTVSGNEFIGGLVGANSADSTITNSYATVGVSGAYNVGGLAGQNYSSSITNSYATGAVSGTENSIGGLVGENYDSSSITNSYASGTVSGTSDVGGLVGNNISSSITNSFYDKEANTGAMGDTASGKTKAEIVTALSSKAGWTTTGGGATVAGYELLLLPYITGVTRTADISKGTLFQSGFGDSTNPYTITNWTQLQNINYNSNVLTSNYFFSLSNNLISTTAGYTNTGTGWNPIGNNTDKFKGTFDGTNHTISNLFINRASQDNIGLFGYTNGATIKNLGLVDVDIKGGDYVGGLVGNNNSSSITNSYASGTVSGGLLVGGLVGQNSNNSSITNSYASGTVNAISANLVGGLVGFNNNSTITNSYASGTVIVAGSAGGLVGQNISPSSITNSFYDKTKNPSMTDETTSGKTTADMKKSSTFTGWDMLEDSNANPDYPTLRMASSGKIWVIGTKATPVTPPPSGGGTPTDPESEDIPDVAYIQNGTASFIPEVVLGQSRNQQVFTPQAGGSTRLPLFGSGAFEIINGGVRLPDGIEQEFFTTNR